jgi:hypothetical protein
MKPTWLLRWSLALSIVGLAHAGLGQKTAQVPDKLMFTARPLKNGNLRRILEQSEAGTGLKMWSYSVTSTRKGSAGKKFKGVMVGGNPFTSKGTTTITMQIVPLIVDIQQTVFDPTVPDEKCAGGNIPLKLVEESPLAMPADFTMNGVNMGKTQYTDAFRRATFWDAVSQNGGTYHNRLKIVALHAIKIHSGTHGSILGQAPCGVFGGIDYFWFTKYLEKQVDPQLAEGWSGESDHVPFIYGVQRRVPVQWAVLCWWLAWQLWRSGTDLRDRAV